MDLSHCKAKHADNCSCKALTRGSDRLSTMWDSSGLIAYHLVMTMLLGHISSIEAYDLLDLARLRSQQGASPMCGPSKEGLGLDRLRSQQGIMARGVSPLAAQNPRGNRSIALPSGLVSYPWTSVEVLTLLGPTDIEASRIASIESLPKPLHLIVPKRAGVHATAQTIPHGWSYAQPLDDLARLRVDGVLLYVCPPEMAIMQMARNLSRGKVALLIDQIAGSYRVIRPEAVPYYRRLRGVSFDFYPKGTNELTCQSATVYGLKPLTSVETLSSYIASMPGAWGARAVRRALSLSADGLASPLEAQQYTLAFCKRVNGSLGLPRPVVNCSLALPREIRKFTGTTEIRPDFYWPRELVALEVNGASWHTGSKGISETSRRQKAYDEMGIKCVTITSAEINSLWQFSAAMDHVAELLGHAMPAETNHFCEARSRLRREVLDLSQTRPIPPEDDEGWLEQLLQTN